MAERTRRDSEVAADSGAPSFAALHRAVHAIQQAVHESALDVTHPEAVVLALLARKRQATMSEIHRGFGFRKSTVTNIVNRLVERGLVERTADPSDGRGWIVLLTRSGVAASRQVTQIFREVEPLVKQILANSNEI